MLPLLLLPLLTWPGLTNHGSILAHTYPLVTHTIVGLFPARGLAKSLATIPLQ